MKMKLIKVDGKKVGDRSPVSNQLQKLHSSVNKIVNQLRGGHTTMTQIAHKLMDEKDFNPAGKTYVEASHARQELAVAMNSLLRVVEILEGLTEETK